MCTQYSAPPAHCADLLARHQSERPFSWHTTNQRIPWLRCPTALLLRLCIRIGADNVRAAPKASNAAEHTKRICSQPRPSPPKHFRRPVVGPVCSCFYIRLAFWWFLVNSWRSMSVFSQQQVIVCILFLNYFFMQYNI